MKLRARWSVLPAVLLALAGCVTNPVTEQPEFTLVNEQMEIALGQQAHPEVIQEFGQYADTAVEGYVSGVGQKITAVSHRKELPYRFTVLDSPIVNAFALPGGGVYVTRGLMAYLNSEAELASVLGHEVGHVTARHGAQAVTRMTSYQVVTGLLTTLDERLATLQPLSDATAGLIFLKYGREAEYQADDLGAGYASESGYDPRWLGAFLRSLAAQEKGRQAPPEFLSSHPSTPARVERADALAADIIAKGGAGTDVGASRYKERLEGLLFGPGPKGWIPTGGRLANKAYRISVAPPADFSVQTGRLAFSVQHHRLESANAEWRIHEQLKTSTVETFAESIEKQANLEGVDRKSFAVGPLDGLKVTYLGRSQGADAVLFIYYATDGQTGHTLAAVTPKSFQDRLEPVYDEMARSARKLSASEAEALLIQKLHLERARGGERLSDLVKRVYGSTEHAEAIAILNGLGPDDQLTEGALTKVVLPKPTL